MVTLSPFLSRSCAVALLVAFMTVSWLLAVAPVASSFANYDQAIAQSSELLARYRYLAGQRSQLVSRLDSLRERQSGQRSTLVGDSVDRAAAGVQNQMTRIIGANGALLKSMQILSPADQDAFRKISVRVSMTADTQATQAVFHAIESAIPYLFVDNVDIRARKARPLRANGSRGDDLRLRFDVSGYMRVSRP